MDQRIAEAIAQRRAMLMKQVSNRRIRDLIAEKQRLLRLARLNGEQGDTIAGEMRKLAQDAVGELKVHLKTVARRYRGLEEQSRKTVISSELDAVNWPGSDTAVEPEPMLFLTFILTFG